MLVKCCVDVVVDYGGCICGVLLVVVDVVGWFDCVLMCGVDGVMCVV